MQVLKATFCAYLVWALRRRMYWCQWQLLAAARRQNNVSFGWCNLSIVVIIVYIMRGCMIHCQMFGRALACLQAEMSKCSFGQHSLIRLCQQQCAVVNMHMQTLGHRTVHMHTSRAMQRQEQQQQHKSSSKQPAAQLMWEQSCS